MAVDEVLLERALADDTATLRLYTWESATLSLGYFQSSADLGRATGFQGLPVVRRASGGGAILHDQEWTYSLSVPPRLARRFPSRDLYTLAHSSMRAVLRSWGISTELHEGGTRPATQADFLCFARRADGDLIADDAKLMGSAQRRRRGALLQHGSVLMKCSRHVPQLPGILDLIGEHSSVTAEALRECWLKEFGLRLGWEFSESGLSDSEAAYAKKLKGEKYSRVDWNVRP